MLRTLTTFMTQALAFALVLLLPEPARGAPEAELGGEEGISALSAGEGDEAGGTIIRLLLKESVETVTVSGLDLRVLDEAGAVRFEGEGQTTLRLTPGPGGVRVDGLQFTTGPLRIESPAGYLWVDSAEEHGALVVHPLPAPSGGAAGPLMVVLHLPIDAYLPGLLLGEVPASWPDAALEAQAIAARSYAISRMSETRLKPFDLYSTTQDQVYGGGGNIPFRLFQAVSRTRGRLLIHDGEVVRAFYHSSCGGHTEVATNVWPAADPFPAGIRCPHCEGAPGASWTLTLGGDALAQRLRDIDVDVGKIKALTPRTQSASGRWVEVEVRGSEGSEVVFGNRFREALGYGALKSLRFSVMDIGGTFEFRGTGYGHGVGMCQWGAKALAQQGLEADAILARYYPGASLSPAEPARSAPAPRGPPAQP